LITLLFDLRYGIENNIQIFTEDYKLIMHPKYYIIFANSEA